jgi:rubrerythrin
MIHMNNQPTTAVPAAEAVEFEPIDRGSFLLKGVLAAGAVYGAASIGPMLSRAFAQGDSGDIDILNFALTLEYLEADFYKQAADQLDLGGDLASLVKEIGENEAEHVTALAGAVSDLGGKPAKEPTFEFGLTDETAFLELAVTLEDTGVSAYNGAGPALKSKELLTTAGAIVQVEARHAAAVRLQAGQPPVIEPFDATLTEDEVLKAVEPFIKS